MAGLLAGFQRHRPEHCEPNAGQGMGAAQVLESGERRAVEEWSGVLGPDVSYIRSSSGMIRKRLIKDSRCLAVVLDGDSNFQRVAKGKVLEREQNICPNRKKLMVFVNLYCYFYISRGRCPVLIRVQYMLTCVVIIYNLSGEKLSIFSLPNS